MDDLAAIQFRRLKDATLKWKNFGASFELREHLRRGGGKNAATAKQVHFEDFSNLVHYGPK